MKASRITALGLVAAAGLWIASGHFLPHDSAESRASVRPNEADAKKLFRVAVTQTTIVQHSRKLVLSGRTEAERRVTVTARTGGVLTELKVRRGARVKEGDIIAILSDDARAAQVAQAESLVTQRRAELEALKNSPRTQVFYEAPHRILETLTDLVEILGETRDVVIARELTKLHEEFLRGRAGDVLRTLKDREAIKGEITLLIGKHEEGHVATATAGRPGVRQRVDQIMLEEKIDEKAALKKVAKERGVSKSEVYREMQKSK